MGVDDKIVSSVFGMGKDFTIVGDWKFIDNKKSGTGLVKASSFYIYNTMIGLDLYINSGSVTNSLDGIKSINAACSDGRAYDRNWNEILANTGNVDGSKVILHIDHYDHLFKSLDMQADDEPQYPYPVYDSSSSEFESILSSKEWVSDVNNEHL